MSNKIVFLLAICSLCLLFSCKRTPAEMQLEKHHFDLGQIMLAERTDTVYVPFCNTGSTPLRISEVSTSCPCMVVVYPQHLIDGGKTDSIQVVFHLDDLIAGTFQKEMTIVSNGVHDRQTVTFTLTLLNRW